MPPLRGIEAAPLQREWLGGTLKSLQTPNKPTCLLLQTCYEMERYLKDEPKLQSYKKLPTELDTAPWNLFRAPPISWTASTGTSAQFDPPIKMEVSKVGIVFTRHSTH